MTQQNIYDILKMRMAVYKAGADAGVWKDVDSQGASEMMTYIFPKTGRMAYYNFILELMHKEHNMFPGEAFSLFNLPVQVEKEMMEHLKTEELDLSQLVSDANAYLQEMDTIITDHSFDIVNIGSFRMERLDKMLRLCASHYRHAFAENVKSYPYML